MVHRKKAQRTEFDRKNAIVEKGEKLLEDGDREGARKIFEQLTTGPFETYIDYLACGVAYCAIGHDLGYDIRKGIAPLKKAAALQPEEVLPYVWLGRAYFVLEESYESIKANKKALELEDPSNTEGRAILLYNTGSNYLREEEEDQAMKFFEKAIETNPEFIEPKYDLANLYEKYGRNDEAEELFKEVLQLALNLKDDEEKPDRWKKPFINSLYKLGVIYEKREDYMLALGYYEKAAQLTTHELVRSAVRRVKEILKEKEKLKKLSS
jgi:tetratricopeptide (TPR) repeat protein